MNRCWPRFIAGCVALMCASSVRANTLDGLVGWWKLNETSGTVAVDSSVYGNNGTLTNGPTYASNCARSGCLSFVDPQYVEIPDSNALDIGGDQMTLAVWVKPTSGDYRTIVAKGYVHAYAMRLTRDSEPIKAFFDIYNVSGVNARAGTYNNIVNGQWTHLAGVYNGSTVCLYVNRVVDGACASLTGSVEPNALTLRVGKSQSLAVLEYFNGAIDDVRIYNRALTAQEVADLYNEGSKLKGLHLNGTWQLNQ
jgi:hypothetical protein